MSTNTFDRPLVIEKEEDIEKFWAFMNAEHEPMPRKNRHIMREMEECAELFRHKVRNARSLSAK